MKTRGFDIREPKPAQDADALLVHSKEHLSQVKTGNYFDPDTPYFENIYEIALLSLGSALAACDSALSGTPAFSLMRPPGHHAGRSSGPSGFCYFNNLAVCAAKAAKAGKKVAIVDVDVHHGNGTDDIVLGMENVLFCSLHQVPLYPGTGSVSQDNCLNFPLSPGTGEAGYLEALEDALRAVRKFVPDLIAVSAGFDTFKEDPLANLRLEVGAYEKIARKIAACSPRRFAVLEGGYADQLPLCVESFLNGFLN